MEISQTFNVSEATGNKRTSSGQLSRIVSNSYQTFFCMVLLLLVLCAVLTAIGTVISIWKYQSEEKLQLNNDSEETTIANVGYTSEEHITDKFSDSTGQPSTVADPSQPLAHTEQWSSEANAGYTINDVEKMTVTERSLDNRNQNNVQSSMKSDETASTHDGVQQTTITFPSTINLINVRMQPESITTDRSTTDTESSESSIEQLTVQNIQPVAPSARKECSTLSCKRSASRMIALMDHAMNPCDNFYQYSCGGAKYNHMKIQSADDELLSTLPEFDELNTMGNSDISTFYKSCMTYQNGDGLVQAAKFLYDMCENNAPTQHKSSDLTDLLAMLISTHPHKSSSRLLPIFDVVMVVGPNQTLMPTITIPDFPSPLADSDDGDLYHRHCLADVQKTFANEPNNSSNIIELYEKCMRNYTPLYARHLEEAIRDLQVFEHVKEALTKEYNISNIMAFIEWTVLNNLGSLSDFDRLAKNKKPPVYESVSYLQQKFPQIIWHRLFSRLLNNDMYMTSPVTMVKLEYVEQLEKIFAFYEENVYIYIKTSLLSMLAHELYIDFVMPQGAAMQMPQYRREYCRKVTVKLMPIGVAELYVNQLKLDGQEDLQTITSELFNEIKQQLTHRIGNNQKISEADKNEITLKLNDLKLIDVPRFGFDIIEEVDLSANNYVQNVLNLKEYKRKQMYGKRLNGNTVNNKYLWTQPISPVATSILRIGHLNTIVVPIGVIASAMPQLHRSQMYEQLSTLGIRIACEIINSLIYGNFKFENLIEAVLNVPTASILNSYSTLAMKMTDDLPEHDYFADHASLRMVRNAYIKYAADESLPWLRFDIAKLFFLTTAQQYCSTFADDKTTTPMDKIARTIRMHRTDQLPANFRVNSMVSHSDGFHEAFNCTMMNITESLRFGL